MPTRLPPRRVPPVVAQAWRDVGFVHWPYDPAMIEPLVPEPLVVDTHQGTAWVSLTPFTTTCDVLSVVPLPGPRPFPETNVRTYVRAPDGSDGLYFFSLDVTNRANVACGRAAGLPYQCADMRHEGSDVHHYRGRRAGPGVAAEYDVLLRPGLVEASGELDVFLTARWSAYIVGAHTVVRVDVHHEPWPLRRADVISVEETMLAAAGVPAPTTDPIAHFATGVDARLAPTRALRTRRAN